MTTPSIVSITDEFISDLEAAANAAISERAAYICSGSTGQEWNRKRIGFQELATDAALLALLAERAELKRDAERYQWLKGGLDLEAWDDLAGQLYDDWDDFIDAAML